MAVKVSFLYLLSVYYAAVKSDNNNNNKSAITRERKHFSKIHEPHCKPLWC